MLVGKRNDKIQRRSKGGKGRKKAKGTNISVWGPQGTDHQTSVARPQRRSLMFPSNEEKKYLNLCTQPETINGQEP